MFASSIYDLENKKVEIVEMMMDSGFFFVTDF